jgi:hypothetical protein
MASTGVVPRGLGGAVLAICMTAASMSGAQEPSNPTAETGEVDTAPAPGAPADTAEAKAAPSEIDRDAARTLVQQGDERLAVKDYEGALVAYLRADDIMGVPTTSIEVGRTLLLLGRLVEAHTAFERAAGFPMKEDEPAPFSTARDDAALLIAEIDPRIPTLDIVVEGPMAEAVELRIDEEVRDRWTEPFRIDPGTHQVVVLADGFERAERSLSVQEGATRHLTIAMVRETAPPPPVTEASSTSLWPFAIAGLSLAGAGLAVGAVTGGLSLADAADAKEFCNDDGSCTPAAKEPLDRSRTLAHVSTTGFVLAGAGAALGATMLVLIFTDEEEGRPGAHLVLGPHQVGIRSRF